MINRQRDGRIGRAPQAPQQKSERDKGSEPCGLREICDQGQQHEKTGCYHQESDLGLKYRDIDYTLAQFFDFGEHYSTAYGKGYEGDGDILDYVGVIYNTVGYEGAYLRVQDNPGQEVSHDLWKFYLLETASQNITNEEYKAYDQECAHDFI